jgi:hypothetical protein
MGQAQEVFLLGDREHSGLLRRGDSVEAARRAFATTLPRELA